MILYKIRRKSDGLFRANGWKNWSVKGRTFTQLGFVTSHIQCNKMYTASPQDYEVVTCELVESGVTDMSDYLRAMEEREKERTAKARERYKKYEAARLLKAYEKLIGVS